MDYHGAVMTFTRRVEDLPQTTGSDCDGAVEDLGGLSQARQMGIAARSTTIDDDDRTAPALEHQSAKFLANNLDEVAKLTENSEGKVLNTWRDYLI